MKDLQTIREEINGIDRELVALFTARMRAVKEVAAYKQAHGLPVTDAAREAAVIEQNTGRVPAELRPYYVSLQQCVMDVSKQYQHRLMSGETVAYSGVEGAFAHVAASRLFPTGEKQPFRSFEEAYAAVENGVCDAAVLPIENSYAGEVGQVLDLMFRGKLFVNGVYTLRVAHHLLGVPGADPAHIKKVVSHPQALAQCAPYITSHGYETEACSNTARAAEAVAAAGDPEIAAVAGEETAALYGLSILDKNINEDGQNTTRFGVFSRADDGVRHGKRGAFILLFTVNNVAGALATAINALGAYGYNMRVLRSRPLKDHPWQYYFYVEAEGDETTAEGQRMLRQLAAHCDLLKVVGHYLPDAALGKGAGT